jgi:hypothetical protein
LLLLLLLTAVVKHVNFATLSVGLDECWGLLQNIEQHPEVLVSTSSECFSALPSSTLPIALTCHCLSGACKVLPVPASLDKKKDL